MFHEYILYISYCKYNQKKSYLAVCIAKNVKGDCLNISNIFFAPSDSRFSNSCTSAKMYFFKEINFNLRIY